MTESIEQTQLTIRPMIESDLEQVLRLERICRLSRWGSAWYSSALKQKDVLLLTASQHDSKDNVQILGFISVRLIMQECEVYNIGVDPQQRRRGIAGRLFDAAVESLIERGTEECWLEVRESNSSARAFYLRKNFKIVNRRPKYYSDPVEDALLMKLKFGTASDEKT